MVLNRRKNIDYTGIQIFVNFQLPRYIWLNLTYFDKMNWNTNDKTDDWLMFPGYLMTKFYYVYICT